MALDIKEELQIRSQNLNIMICIFQKNRLETEKSHINETLEKIQRQLADKKKSYNSVKAAYTFSDKLVDVRDFEEVTDNTIYYLDSRGKASFSSVYFMGMSVLERQMARDREAGINSDNYFCLVTDAPFPRTEVGKILSTPRFKHMDMIPVLVKDEGSAGGVLEKYFKGQIYTIKKDKS